MLEALFILAYVLGLCVIQSKLYFASLQQCNRTSGGYLDHSYDRERCSEGPCSYMDPSSRWCRYLRRIVDMGEKSDENYGGRSYKNYPIKVSHSSKKLKFSTEAVLSLYLWRILTLIVSGYTLNVSARFAQT